MHWENIEHSQHRLAGVGRQRLIDPGVVLVATIRRDGTARISPVEPLVLDGDLWLSMMWQSAKARDLLRDPRVLVHSIVTSREGAAGEFKVRGTARAENNPAMQRRYADTVSGTLGWSPQPGQFHLFAVDIDQVSFISYDTASGDQHVAMWPPGREFVRRGTSATSVGDPEPVNDLIVLGRGPRCPGGRAFRVRGWRFSTEPGDSHVRNAGGIVVCFRIVVDYLCITAHYGISHLRKPGVDRHPGLWMVISAACRLSRRIRRPASRRSPRR
jgi:hypothetical protein